MSCARRLAAGGARSSRRRHKNGEIIMTQENENRKLTTRSAEIENIETAAQEDAFDKFLNFRKGDYFIGEEEVPPDTDDYLAFAKAWTKIWIKRVDGKIVERKPYRVAKGERAPEREDLDDLDNKDNWPLGLDEKPEDPWQLFYILPLENISSGQVVIFSSRWFGGRRAVADLCMAWVKRTKKQPDSGQPIIRLAVGEMPTKKFGKVPCPVFKIVGWDEPPPNIEVLPPDDDAEFRPRRGDDDFDKNPADDSEIPF
jgi:hypothetical protein